MYSGSECIVGGTAHHVMTHLIYSCATPRVIIQWKYSDNLCMRVFLPNIKEYRMMDNIMWYQGKNNCIPIFIFLIMILCFVIHIVVIFLLHFIFYTFLYHKLSLDYQLLVHVFEIYCTVILIFSHLLYIV